MLTCVYRYIIILLLLLYFRISRRSRVYLDPYLNDMQHINRHNSLFFFSRFSLSLYIHDYFSIHTHTVNKRKKKEKCTADFVAFIAALSGELSVYPVFRTYLLQRAYSRPKIQTGTWTTLSVNWRTSRGSANNPCHRRTRRRSISISRISC